MLQYALSPLPLNIGTINSLQVYTSLTGCSPHCIFYLLVGVAPSLLFLRLPSGFRLIFRLSLTLHCSLFDYCFFYFICLYCCCCCFTFICAWHFLLNCVIGVCRVFFPSVLHVRSVHQRFPIFHILYWLFLF